MTENYRGFCIRPLSESYELDKKTIDKLLDCLNTKDLIEDNDFQLTIKAYHASMNMLLFLILKNNCYFNKHHFKMNTCVNYKYQSDLSIKCSNFPMLISKSSMVGFLIFKLCKNCNLFQKESIMIGKRLKTNKCAELIKYPISEFNYRNNIQLKQRDGPNPYLDEMFDIKYLTRKFNASNRNKKSHKCFLSKFSNIAKEVNTRYSQIIIEDKWAINLKYLYIQIISLYIDKVHLTDTKYKSSKVFTKLCIFVTKNKWILSSDLYGIFGFRFFFMTLIYKMLEISSNNGIPSSIYTILDFFPEMLEKKIIPFVNIIEPNSLYYYSDIQFLDNHSLFGEIKKKVDKILLKNVTMQ